MEQNRYQIFDKTTLNKIKKFCNLNKIDDIDEFIKKCFDAGFNIEKYGLLGKTLNVGEKDLKIDEVQEKWLEKEVIVEKRVEIPVEVIKEVEKIVEVPVDRIIEKIIEVPVDRIIEKEVYITDDEQIKELSLNLEKLKTELIQKDKQILDLIEKLKKPSENDNEKMLQATLQKLRKENLENKEKIKELIEINKNLENIGQSKKNVVYLRGSNLNDTLW